MRRAPFVVAVLTAASASCQLVYGLDDFHPTGSTSSGASTSGGNGGAGGSGSGSGASAGAGATGGAGDRCGPAATCAAATPAGFDGLFNLVESAPQDAPTHCASGAAPLTFHEGTPKGCSDCGCDDPPAHACTKPGMTTWAGITSCPIVGGLDIGTFAGLCATNPGRFQVDPAMPICNATGGQIQETDFPTTATLCRIDVPRGECGPGLACAPTGSPVCIVQSNAVDCPAPFNARTVVYGNKMDDRACSTCTCTPQFACQNGWNQFTSSDCSGTGMPLAPGACSQAASAIYEDLQPTGTVACTPNQVSETGTFTPTEPHTVCCATF